MAITFSCLSCGKRYSVDDKWAGKRVQCKACAQVMAVPSARPASAPDEEEPLLAELYEEEAPAPPVKKASRPASPTTPKPAPRPAPVEPDDELPPPRRIDYRKTKSKVKDTSSSDLPFLVKWGLILIGGLLAFGCLVVLFAASSRGQMEVVRPVMGMLLLFTFAGVAVVCNLKLLFMGYDEGYGGLPWYTPFRRLVWIVNNWERTGPFAIGWLIGIGGIAGWCFLGLPALKTINQGKHTVAIKPLEDDAYNGVIVIVENVSSNDAAGLIHEKLLDLLPPNEGRAGSTEWGTKQPARYHLVPVSDPRGLADHITFGRVTKVERRTIYVTANPISADEIAAFKARMAANQPPRIDHGESKLNDVAFGGFDVPTKEPTPASGPPPENAPHPAPNDSEMPMDSLSNALAVLKSSDAHERRRAAIRLSRMAAEDDRRADVQEALRPLLDDEDGFVVIEAARAMAAWVTPETVPSLIPKTEDDRFNVRWEVMKILGKLGDARAAKAIATRLKEDRGVAGPALRELGPAAEPALIELLKNPDPTFRRESCRVLQDIGGAATLAFMKTAKPDPDLGARAAAQQAMRAIMARVGTGKK